MKKLVITFPVLALLFSFLAAIIVSAEDSEILPYEPGPYPWKPVTAVLLMLLVVIFIIYGILQIWYKRRYEAHLFRNRDDLFNLINFIYNSRFSGTKDPEIKSKLLKASWKTEQITYAFKKLDGKRTGMFEIPIFNLFDSQRIEKEMVKKYPKTPNARFIKRV